MTFEEHVYHRLACKGPGQLLSSYGGNPAVFYHSPPADVDEGWENKGQYPRITYFIHWEKENNNKQGSLIVRLWNRRVPAGGTLLEIEKKVKSVFHHCFFPFDWGALAATWVGSTPIPPEKEAAMAGGVAGMELQFSLIPFPHCRYPAPDPVQALYHWSRPLGPCRLLVEKGKREPFIPTREKPVLYWRLKESALNRETNTVRWLDGVFACHIIGPGGHNACNPQLAHSGPPVGPPIQSLENEWVLVVTNQLAKDMEVPLLDGSPLFIQEITARPETDPCKEGQIILKAQYGILTDRFTKRPLRYAGYKLKEKGVEFHVPTK